MAENLKRLVSNETLRTLQEKLDFWLKEYNTNTCDQNLNHCLELIEQVAKVQGQLFGILTAAAQEGGRNDGVETIKSRLLPWLEASFTAASLGKSVDSKVPSLQDTFDRERHKDPSPRDRDMQQLDSNLNSTRSQCNQVQDELKSLQAQEDARHRNTDQRSSENRRSEPWSLEERKREQWNSLKQNADQQDTEAMSDYKKQLRNLKEEIAVLSAEKSALQGRSSRSRSPSPAPRSRSCSRSRSASPSTAVKVRRPSPNRSKLSNVARKAALLSRFSDSYSQARLDAQCLLRRCIDKAETVQRIIYIATVDVIRAMNVNPKISFPPVVDFCLLSDFIQEICCIAFAMQALEPPLDIAYGADGEVFNDCKYRRSYDSDFTAPLVLYHVWPALMENDCVIMKGEAVTRRGAFWNSVRSVSRCRSRSLSPICPRSQIGLNTMSRSRSPSPIRCGLPRF